MWNIRNSTNNTFCLWHVFFGGFLVHFWVHGICFCSRWGVFLSGFFPWLLYMKKTPRNIQQNMWQKATQKILVRNENHSVFYKPKKKNDKKKKVWRKPTSIKLLIFSNLNLSSTANCQMQSKAISGIVLNSQRSD